MDLPRSTEPGNRTRDTSRDHLDHQAPYPYVVPTYECDESNESMYTSSRRRRSDESLLDNAMHPNHRLMSTMEDLLLRDDTDSFDISNGTGKSHSSVESESNQQATSVAVNIRSCMCYDGHPYANADLSQSD